MLIYFRMKCPILLELVPIPTVEACILGVAPTQQDPMVHGLALLGVETGTFALELQVRVTTTTLLVRKVTDFTALSPACVTAPCPTPPKFASTGYAEKRIYN